MARERYISFYLTFQVGDTVYELIMEILDEWTGWMKFIQDIKDGKDSRLGPIEYSNDIFHVWHTGNDKLRFIIQNGWRFNSYGRTWTKLEFSYSENQLRAQILPWQYAIDIEVDKLGLLSVLQDMLEEMRRTIIDVYSPNQCPVFSEALPVPTETIIEKNGRKYDYFRPYRWISAGCERRFEHTAKPHMIRRVRPPHDIDFNVQAHHITDEYFIEISHKNVCINLLMPK